MPVSFASPSFLLLALLLPLVWWIGRRSLGGLEPGRRRLALGLRLAVVTLLVLALAEVEWRGPSERVEVVFVVDHSRSVPDDQAALALEAIERSRQRMDPRRELAKVVVFGREGLNEATLRADQAPLRRFGSDIDRMHTNVEEGLRSALQAFEADVRRRIVLFSDGNETAGDAHDAIALARARGVPIDVVPLEYSYDQEVLVEKVTSPHETKLSEPFSVRVVTHARAPTEANLHLWRDGALVETRRVALEPGPNVEQFQLVVDEAGFFRVEAVVEPLEEGADRLFQNNTAHGFVFARGEAQVLYVHDDVDPDAAEGQHLLAALRQEAIRLKVIPAAELPLNLGEMQAYDAIILDDVERAAFSARQQENIEKAVGDLGLGLIMIGGARSFGAGDWRGSPVERALPVEMDIQHEEVIPDGALIVILHSSEYPDGNALAIKVTQKAVDGLSAKDTFGVLVYDWNKGSTWGVPPTKAENKEGIKKAVGALQIGDMPDFDEIFRLALGALRNLDSAVKHMLVMSDGDPSPPAAALLQECRERNITVSTICYYAHGGAQGPYVEVMRRMANMTGGQYYYLERADQLPQIFTKESQRIARSLIVNQTFAPAVRTRSTVLAGVDDFPALRGYVLTEPKPRAEVALVAPDGSPILAHWQYGVGKALAFTSDAKPRWAADWVGWEGFRGFWAQAVRWASKDVQEQVFAVSASLRGDRGQIVLDAVTEDGEVVDGLSVTARIDPPSDGGEEGAEPIEVRLQQRGPGRYEGEFPTSKVGTYSVSLLSLDQDGQRRHSVTTGLVVPYSDEFRHLESNRPFLEDLAAQAGGRVIEPAALIDWAVDPWARGDLAATRSLEERWPLALALALFLFLLDVAVRRVAIDWGKLLARATGAVRLKPASERGTVDRLRERQAAAREARSEGLAKFSADGVERGAVEVAGDPASDPGSAGDAPARVLSDRRPRAPAAAPPSAPPGEEGYTNRLLAAKRRARKSIDDDGRGDDAGGSS